MLLLDSIQLYDIQADAAIGISRISQIIRLPSRSSSILCGHV